MKSVATLLSLGMLAPVLVNQVGCKPKTNSSTKSYSDEKSDSRERQLGRDYFRYNLEKCEQEGEILLTLHTEAPGNPSLPNVDPTQKTTFKALSEAEKKIIDAAVPQLRLFPSAQEHAERLKQFGETPASVSENGTQLNIDLCLSPDGQNVRYLSALWAMDYGIYPTGSWAAVGKPVKQVRTKNLNNLAFGSGAFEIMQDQITDDLEMMPWEYKWVAKTSKMTWENWAQMERAPIKEDLYPLCVVGVPLPGRLAAVIWECGKNPKAHWHNASIGLVTAGPAMEEFVPH